MMDIAPSQSCPIQSQQGLVAIVLTVFRAGRPLIALDSEFAGTCFEMQGLKVKSQIFAEEYWGNTSIEQTQHRQPRLEYYGPVV
jgi:hypothetical protein